MAGKDSMAVKIKGETLMYGDIYAQAYLKNVEIHGFEVEGRAFVDTQRSIFEFLWRNATPISLLM